MRTQYFLQRFLTRIASIRLTQWALIALLASAIAATGTLFHPKIQERLVLKYIAPSFEYFTVQHIHLLPWSLNATDLSFEIQGAKVSAQALSIRFCLSSLLNRTLNLKSISLVDAIVDLRSFIPSDAEPEEPFAGVFPLLDQGFGLNLGDVDINGFALLNSTDHIRLEIAGGRIEPHEVGALSFVSTMKINDGDSVKLAGTLEIDQLSKGHFNAISLTTDSTIDTKSLPHPERIHLQAVVKPTVQPPRRKVEMASGDLEFEPQPESIELSVRVGTENQAAVQLKALYDGRLGDLKGDYKFDADNKFLASYMGNVAIPAFEHSAGGTLEINLVDLRGQLSLTNRTDFTNVRRLLLDNPKAPMNLSLIQKIGLSFTDEQVTLERIQAEIEDDSTTELLTTGLLQPVVIPWADPSVVLNEAATFLTLTVSAVQLEWLDSFVADYGVMSGVVSGSFAVKSDGEGRLIVEPSATTVIDNIRVDSGDTPLFEDLKIELKPLLRASTDNASVALNDIVVSLAEQPIATLKFSASVPTGEKNDSDIRFTMAGSVQVDPIIADPRIQTQLVDFEIPSALTFDFNTKLTQGKKSWLIRSLNASLAQDGKDKLIDVHSTQKINVALASGEQDFVQPVGELANIFVNGFDLEWVSPFAEPLGITGNIRHASFKLTTGHNHQLLLESIEPLDVRRLSIVDGATHLLDNVWLSIRPTVSYTPESIDVQYRELILSGGKHPIAKGSGTVRVKTQKDHAATLHADGDLHLDLGNFGTQPIFADVLSDIAIDRSLSAKLRYELHYAGASVHIDSLNFDLLHDRTAYVQIEVADGLTLKPTLAAGDDFAQYATGEIELSIKELSSSVVNDVFPLDNLSFDTINGLLNLTSDGKRLFAETAEPLVVKQVKLTNTDGELQFDPFEFRTSGSIALVKQTIKTTLDKLAVQFQNKATPALSGRLSATIEPAQTIPLQQLNADINGVLPQLLNQPAVLPQHSLTEGSIAATIAVDPQGNISAITRIENLAASTPLAIHTIALPLTGNMRPDGNGFDFTMPLVGVGSSGNSDSFTVGNYLPQAGKPTLLRLSTTSQVFYLNDILATIDSISPKQPEDPAGSEIESAPIALDETADKRAFWNLLPYDTQFNFKFDRVFYSDYVAITGITGQANLRDEVLELVDFEAHFHESPFTFNGGLTFDAEQPKPYTADIVGKVENFDLNQFFTELLPKEKSRIEGLFGVDIKIAGSSPNAAQFHNQLLLDLRMKSREGLFRPLPLDSVLMIGASDALGLVGEGLSYLPTGGFGAGAVSRLANYIAEIDYDSVDIRIKRDSSLDLIIKRVEMLSPEVRITASGTIAHASGKDIVDSPMDVEAKLNMTGKGAAILYSLNLLQDEQDKFDYWKGPHIKITGSPSAPESNFAAIVQRASDATIKGGIFRPIAGLIGNIKHRWFGKDANVHSAMQEIIDADSAKNPPP